MSAVRPTDVATQAALLTSQEISKAESKTFLPGDTIGRSTQSPLPTPTITPSKGQALPGGFPTEPGHIKDTRSAEVMPPGDSPVTNIAHRKPTYINECPIPIHAAVNKLDEEPAAKKSTTPTQQRLLERLQPVEQKVQPTKTVLFVTQSEVETAGAEQSESPGGTRIENPDAVPVVPVVDARPSHRYNTMDVFDAMERQYFSHQASMEFNSAADGFQPGVEDGG